MTLDELKDKLASLQKVRKICDKREEEYKKEYVRKNAKFKVGDHVFNAGGWLYGDPSFGHKLKDLRGRVDSVYLQHDLKIGYRIIPDADCDLRDYGFVVRDQESLTAVSQVTIE